MWVAAPVDRFIGSTTKRSALEYSSRTSSIDSQDRSDLVEVHAKPGGVFLTDRPACSRLHHPRYATGSPRYSDAPRCVKLDGSEKLKWKSRRFTRGRGGFPPVHARTFVVPLAQVLTACDVLDFTGRSPQCFGAGLMWSIVSN